jgi:uncharacterized 2Fe-2S/4Fe-4S cluster protein (DUF4445 family)
VLVRLPWSPPWAKGIDILCTSAVYESIVKPTEAEAKDGMDEATSGIILSCFCGTQVMEKIASGKAKGTVFGCKVVSRKDEVLEVQVALSRGDDNRPCSIIMFPGED